MARTADDGRQHLRRSFIRAFTQCTDVPEGSLEGSQEAYITPGDMR
ncbi:hypothetical protein [Nesterenkonia aerolata]|uniref:Uncharacterized protein n=1 Tax=Nesterenkonia aerolata TaxID=3074079 RepID=A0ABU2DRD2_9MICC|nr:hypothetical protein [Nesterenkonia sp. LY-0111]MDR8018880.1 hypothetical protein [Nesterenkonia sp. LY-0111]